MFSGVSAANGPARRTTVEEITAAHFASIQLKIVVTKSVSAKNVAEIGVDALMRAENEDR
jgi:hypothetical protein